MPLTPAQEAALQKFLGERKAYDNSEGMRLRGGSIDRDIASREGVSSIDEAMSNVNPVSSLRDNTQGEASVLQQAKQGLDQSNFVRAARGRALNPTPPSPQPQPQPPGPQSQQAPSIGQSRGYAGGPFELRDSAQPAQPQQQQQAPPQQQGEQNWAQRMMEGFSSGVQSMSIQQARMMQAQAQMKQFEVQDQMRTQAAQQNFPQFQQKMKAFRPFFKQFVDQKKREDPNFVPSTQAFVEASEKWDEHFPEMAISQTDQDTFNRTAQGTQALLSMGLLPLNEMLEVKKLGLAEDAKQKSAFMASLMGAPSDQREMDWARQQYGIGQSPQGQPQPQIGQAGQPQDAGGGQPSSINANITPEMNANFERMRSQPYTSFQRGIQADVLKRQADIMEDTAKQRAKDKAIPTMNGQEANAMMQQRMAPLLNDPSTLKFYGDDQRVSEEQMNKDAEELGKNLRHSRTAESKESLQSERLAAKSSESEKTRTAAAQLATMKVESLSQSSDKNRDLRMRLAVMDDQFKTAQQNRTFTQQQQQDQYKAEASLNKQREMLQTKAGIAFTLEGMKSDPDQAIKFALEAERAGNATARGLIGDVLETNPSLAWPILERLGNLSKENGLSANSVTAVKGAVEDYMKRKATFSAEEMAQDIVNGPGTDKDKNTKLAMELRKAKSAGNAKTTDYYQFLLDSRKSAGQSINIDNRPPPEGGIGLGKPLTKEQTSQLIATQDGIGLIGDLRGYIKSSPIAGVSGLSERIQNYVSGTMYDFSRIQEGVADETYRKMFNPNIDPGILLANKLKYIVARVNDPTGRLSDKDIESVNIGTGVMDNTLSLESTINGLEKEMFRVMRDTSERLGNNGIKLTPTASDRDMVIQSFADDPDFRKYPEGTLKIMVQEMFLKSDVMIGKTELNDIIREIKKRHK